MKTFGTLALLALITLMTPAAQAQTDSPAPVLSQPALTSAEMCQAACERDFAICGDEGASARDSLNGRPGAHTIDTLRCKNDLKTCLNGCRGL